VTLGDVDDAAIQVRVFFLLKTILGISFGRNSHTDKTFFGVSGPLCLSSSALHFSDYSFLVNPLITGMTGISLHMQ
jgi:hypothetical protein